MSNDWAQRSGIGNLPPDLRAIRMACQAWKEILANYYGVQDVEVDCLQDDETFAIMFAISLENDPKNREKFTNFIVDFNSLDVQIEATHQRHGDREGLTFHNCLDAVNFLTQFWQNKNYYLFQELPAPLPCPVYTEKDKLPDFAIRHLNAGFYDGFKSAESEINYAYNAAAVGHPMFQLTFCPGEIARVYNASERSKISADNHRFITWYH